MLPVTRNLLPTVSRFLDEDWNSLFDWTNRNFSTTATTVPSVNIKEEADQFVVEMAAPGMKKNDFQIELNNNTLTIKSEVQRDEEEKMANGFLRREFSYQSFQRSFNLNNKVVDDAKIKATYQDGVLRLNLPKKEEAKVKPARFIKIS
jgi:HSP20 family protein